MHTLINKALGASPVFSAYQTSYRGVINDGDHLLRHHLDNVRNFSRNTFESAQLIYGNVVGLTFHLLGVLNEQLIGELYRLTNTFLTFWQWKLETVQELQGTEVLYAGNILEELLRNAAPLAETLQGIS
jgi:hypothetical protein